MFLCEKTTKYKEKVRWKSAKTAISGILRAFSIGKKFSLKLDSVMFCAYLIHIFEQKIRKNKWQNLEKMPKKLFFPAYFQHFRPKKHAFRKSGSKEVFWIKGFNFRDSYLFDTFLVIGIDISNFFLFLRLHTLMFKCRSRENKFMYKIFNTPNIIFL